MTRNSSMRFVLSFLVGTVSLAPAQSSRRISLDDAVILVDGSEASYVQYAAKDLGSYLTEITGKTAVVSNSVSASRKAKAVIAVGSKMATAMGAELDSTSQLDQDTSVIRLIAKSGARRCSRCRVGSARHQYRRCDAHADDSSGWQIGLSRWPARSAKQTQLCRSGHSPERLAAELSLCFSLVEGSRLEAIHRHRLGSTNQSVLPVALHGNSPRSTFFRRRSLSAGSQTRSGLRAEPARHGSLDHAVGEPHWDVRLRHARSQVPALLGQRLSEGHEPGRSAAVRAGAEVI